MQWGEAKFEGIQILYIEFWAGPIPQVFFATVAEVTFLAVVCIGPVCFDLEQISMKQSLWKEM